MNCCKARQLFSTYLDGELKPKIKTEFEAHLAQCPECLALLEFTRNLSQELKNLPESQPPPALINTLYLIPEKAASGEKAEEKKRVFSWKFWLNPVFQPVLTSLTVVLIALSMLFFTTPGRSLKKLAALELRHTYSLAQKTLVKAGVITDKLSGYGQDFIASLEAKSIYKSENN
ncbi:MAG: anti-sigma factor family protein [Candidatus Saccharicenans sp.]